MNRKYTHWLKIDGCVSEKNEYKQYSEIINYLQAYPTAEARIFRYEFHLFHRVVKLECHQSWNDLDLSANTMSHNLHRLARKPKNLMEPVVFSVPERLKKLM